jgi:hypothetical protein
MNPSGTVYQHIIAPMLPLLQKKVDQLKNDAYTFSFKFFTLNLCYAIVTCIGSIRLLITEAKTHEIIMLYAYRWQIELFFCCFKRCFNGLHLWSHEPKGIEIQFYLHRIVYLLSI